MSGETTSISLNASNQKKPTQFNATSFTLENFEAMPVFSEEYEQLKRQELEEMKELLLLRNNTLMEQVKNASLLIPGHYMIKPMSEKRHDESLKATREINTDRDVNHSMAMQLSMPMGKNAKDANPGSIENSQKEPNSIKDMNIDESETNLTNSTFQNKNTKDAISIIGKDSLKSIERTEKSIHVKEENCSNTSISRNISPIRDPNFKHSNTIQMDIDEMDESQIYNSYRNESSQQSIQKHLPFQSTRITPPSQGTPHSHDVLDQSSQQQEDEDSFQEHRYLLSLLTHPLRMQLLESMSSEESDKQRASIALQRAELRKHMLRNEKLWRENRQLGDEWDTNRITRLELKRDKLRMEIEKLKRQFYESEFGKT